MGYISLLYLLTYLLTYLITYLHEQICSLVVIIDRRLLFESQISAVVKSCNYHLWELQHIRHLLPFSIAQTFAVALYSQ